MPGPTPKPAGRAVGHRDRALVVVDPDSTPALPSPEPDRSWLKVTREGWTEFWTSPLGQFVCDSDEAAVRRLFALRDERERCFREVKRTGRMVTGSQGQDVINPLYRHMAVIDAEIRQMEDRLGLTPMARLKLGIALGQAAAAASGPSAFGDDDEEDDAGDRFGFIEATAVPAAQ